MKNVVTDPEKVTRILKTATEIFGQQGFIKHKYLRACSSIILAINKRCILTLSNMPIIEFMITWTLKSGRMPLAWLP